MKWNLGPAKLGDLPQIVDPVAMIGMIVRDDHAIDLGNPGSQQLFSKVGPAVHQQGFTAALDQDRRAGAPVSRFGGIAVAPVVPNPWNPG